MFKFTVATRNHSAFIATLCAAAMLLLTATSTFATTNAAFVEKAYEDVLLRPASPGDIALWSSQLDSAAITRQQFAAALLNSQEYSRVRAIEFYNDYLARTPTATEANNLTNTIQNVTIPIGRTTLLGGAEYFTTQAGGTNAGFLNALFIDLLNRPIDPGSSSLFQSQLAGGATRADIANEVQGTAEWRNDIVTTYYQQFLHRDPDPQGLNLYTGLLLGGATEQDVIAGLISSQEYFQNVPEPATLSILCLLPFAFTRRRRR